MEKERDVLMFKLHPVTDVFSGFVLHRQAINSLSHDEVDRICDELMKKYGMPERIRTDNGTPFSSISGLRISKLSIKWMRLGITHERIEPGKPTQKWSTRKTASHVKGGYCHTSSSQF